MAEQEPPSQDPEEEKRSISQEDFEAAREYLQNHPLGGRVLGREDFEAAEKYLRNHPEYDFTEFLDPKTSERIIAEMNVAEEEPLTWREYIGAFLPPRDDEEESEDSTETSKE